MEDITHNIIIDDINNKQYYDMSNYNFLHTPPMSGSEGSLSPQNYTFQSTTNDYGWSANDPGIGLPYLEIQEQPAKKFRFRYKSEMAGTHGSLNGNNTEKNRKQTFPTVQLKNFSAPAIIRCSLYQCTKNIKNRQPHAHRLVQKVGSEEVDDPHDKTVTENEKHTAVFHNMGIIHTAKKHLIEELYKKKLKIKEEDNRRKNIMRVNTIEEVAIKKEATEESKSINLNIVCLRFDAFHELNGALINICDPIYSDEIYNLKSALTGELKIVRMDHCTSPAQGQKEIFLLVEKVTKKNIKVRFFEMDDYDQEIWQAEGIFNDTDVHHQYAIVIKTPPYRDLEISEVRSVFIELLRPSDGARSVPLQFSYHPDKCSKRKRPRYEYSSSNFSSGDLPTTLQDDVPEINGAGAAFSSAELFQFVNEVDPEQFDDLMKNIGVVSEQFVPEKHLRPDNIGYAYGETKLKKDTDYIKRSYQELNSLLQTKPSDERIKQKLQCIIKENTENNALHLAFMYNRSAHSRRFITLILDLIKKHGQNNLLNEKNRYGETVLHIAVNNNMYNDVIELVNLDVDITSVNNEGNTALHLSIIKRNECYTALLKASTLHKLLDIENYNGLHTALQLAVENNNIVAVIELCKAGANVNTICKKSGHTLLHTAVSNGHKQIVKLLLDFKHFDLTREDFSGTTCQILAHSLLSKHDTKNRSDILRMIEDKLKIMGLYNEIEIKKECDSDSEDFEVEIVIKEENLSIEDLKSMYQKVHEFSPPCIEELSAILNVDNKWKGLPKLIDLDCLLSTDLFSSSSNPTKTLLEIALGRGVSVFQIRMSLQEIGECDAVKCIDDMVSTFK